MSFDTKAFLRDLRHEVETHPAVNHTFLGRVATNPFTREDYKVFGCQHYPLVGMFTTYMERLLLNGPDSESKTWLAKVLVDEYGEGSDGKDHSTLYREYLTACGVGPGEEDQVVLDHRVVRFVRDHLWVTSQQPFLVGLGALGPGHEWAIPRMFELIIEGQRRAGFTEEEILYFTLHTEQDIEHAEWLEEALAQLITTSEQAAQVRKGALFSLEARGRFWEGVQESVVRWRQPEIGMDIPGRARRWLGSQQPRLAQISRSLGSRAVVFRPQVMHLKQLIPAS